jgi:hypothetical protein
MSWVSRLRVLARSLVAWSVLVFPTLAWGQEATLVQQIGERSSEVAEAVAAEVEVVPFSPEIDVRATPIIVAPGEMFLTRNGGQVRGLSGPERGALRQAYDAGQVILLLDASTHDIEALHLLLDDGVAHTSTTDPVVLAYALRRENNIPTAQLVTYPSKELDLNQLSEDELDERELAMTRALEIVVEELTRPPAAPEDDDATADPANWKNSPVQAITIKSTDRGTYNTPIELYALHSCLHDKDFYLVNTGGTWTPEFARYQSASRNLNQMRLVDDVLVVDWNDSKLWCDGGSAIFFENDRRICRYIDYPLSYTVEIVPPPAPTGVAQVNAAPAGDQGQSTSYTSGFSFSIGGGVDVSGSGPSGGFQAGVSWDNSVTTTVPALVIQAGNTGNQGTFTRYKYCTGGDRVQNCTSSIRMTGEGGACREFVVGQPQQGQTPNGRLSNVAQTVNWEVDPTTYGGSTTFDVTVTFTGDVVVSTSYLWNVWSPTSGPRGMCNAFGCSCGIVTNNDPQKRPVITSHTFKVPHPSTKCSP